MVENSNEEYDSASDVDEASVVESEMSQNSTIKIFARIRPPRNSQHLSLDKYKVDSKQSLPTIFFKVNRDESQGLINNQKENFEFKFNHIFDIDAKQEELFDVVAKDVVLNVLEGYNGTIFAYGQTGSGKTFTITGGAERYEDRGLIPRSIQFLFKHIKSQQDCSYEFKISYLEIYSEVGYDLLDTTRDAKKLEDLTKVTMHEDGEGRIHLRNLSCIPVTNEEEALNLLFVGDTNKMIAETPSNPASSRSHCIFIIQTTCRKGDVIRKSKLHLVDLAGSERVHRTQIDGTLLKEAKYINLSLHYLEQVIVALHEKSQGRRSHIPYRNSMMTSVLRDSIGGNCKTTMIATTSVEDPLIDESISTCRFAQRVALISNRAKLNEEVDPQLIIKRLRREIERLKAELAIAKGNANFDEELPTYEVERVKLEVDGFLKDTSMQSTPIFGDYRKVICAFGILKKYLSSQSHIQAQPTETSNASGLNQEPELLNEVEKLRNLIAHRDNEIQILVGMIKAEKKGTGSLRHNPSNESPTLSVARASPLPAPPKTPTKATAMSAEKTKAFEIFKSGYPAGSWIEGQKTLLKVKYSEAKFLGESANKLRNEIKHLKQLVADDHHDREEIIKAKMPQLITRYKDEYQKLKDMKIEIEHLHHLLDQARHRLTRDFEHWFETVYLETQKQEAECEKKELMRSHKVDSGKDLFECIEKSELTATNAGIRTYSEVNTLVGKNSPAESILSSAKGGVKEDIQAFYLARERLLRRNS